MTTGKPVSRLAGEPVGEPGSRRAGEPGDDETRMPRVSGSPAHRFAGSPVRRLRQHRDGLSALFDAILFFIIILAATGALFFWASALTASTTDDLSTRDMGRYAAGVLSSGLECTVGPMDYSVSGVALVFSGGVYDALSTVIAARSADSNCEISALVDAVQNVFCLLVERPFHHGLKASVEGFGSDLSIPESPGASMNPGAVRWTSAVPLIVNGLEGELTLYIWR